MNYTLEDIYEDFDMRSDLEIPKALFRSICSEYNQEIIESVLDGSIIDLGNNLSNISIARIKRNPSKPVIDWGESNKYREELLEEGYELYNTKTGKGKKWYIYYTDEEYCRFYWNKGKCRVPNKSVYKFVPTRGLKGNKEKLVELLKTDDLAYLKFKKK
jgi:hypothetical protein